MPSPGAEGIHGISIGENELHYYFFHCKKNVISHVQVWRKQTVCMGPGVSGDMERKPGAYRYNGEVCLADLALQKPCVCARGAVHSCTHAHPPHTHTAKHPSAGKRKQTEACSHTPTLHTAEDEYVHSGNIPHVPGVWQALLWVFRVSQRAKQRLSSLCDTLSSYTYMCDVKKYFLNAE